MLLLVQHLGYFLVRWVLKVGSEGPEVLLLFVGVMHLESVELGFFPLHLLFDHARESNSDVVVGALGDLLAEFLEALG